MNSELKVGDVVLFQFEKSRWPLQKNNPENVYGAVSGVDEFAPDYIWLAVDWASGESNIYKATDSDLKKVGRLK